MVFELYVLELIGYRFLAFGLKRRKILTVWNEIGKGKSHINYFWSENIFLRVQKKTTREEDFGG